MGYRSTTVPHYVLRKGEGVGEYAHQEGGAVLHTPPESTGAPIESFSLLKKKLGILS